MWALKVTWSTMAATSRGSGKSELLTERKIGPDADRGALLAFGDDLEQQRAPARVDLDGAEFIEQQQVQAAVAADHAGSLPFVGGLDQLVHQLSGW
jgi:hypothetical protein